MKCKTLQEQPTKQKPSILHSYAGFLEQGFKNNLPTIKFFYSIKEVK